MRKSIVAVVILLLATGLILIGCSDDNETATSGDTGPTGTLEFNANGEDFVRQGFISKDGWNINFDHVYAHLAGINAYQTDPPYDPHHDGANVEANMIASLAGVHTVDLAKGDENAEPIMVDAVAAPAGHYNAVSWQMIPATSGPTEGYSLVIIGTAEKDAQNIDFTIKVETEYEYICGEFVGDERKGFVIDGGTADVEMTFHFDHVFGDAETSPDDALNVGAVGFDAFAAIAEGGVLNENLAGLETKLSAADYQALVYILPTLGHVGEGHCHCE